jgi:hypothetical protein
MTESSKWQHYKEKLGETRPWDMLNPNTEYAFLKKKEIRRYDICKACPELIDLTKQCKQMWLLYGNGKTEASACHLPIREMVISLNVLRYN